VNGIATAVPKIKLKCKGVIAVARSRQVEPGDLRVSKS